MPDIKIVKAQSKDKSVIANLIQLYLYDMTEYYKDWPIGTDGRYEYTMLDAFWQYPYLIYEKEKLVGFSLVIDYCPITNEKACWFMAELFILRLYRNRGLASEVCKRLFALHEGKWHIGVITQNIGANMFWDRLLSKCTAQARQHDGASWKLFKFTTQEGVFSK